ncbi:hypothetical protein ACFLS1_07255 [Verrucomicrobiota bacterium]
MNILLLLITITVSFVIVRAGAIAFELTGLERSIARFQSLSCFSGTGFTTKESETIVSHPQRRHIATILIILGNVGLVTMIATFANSLRPNVTLGSLLGKFMPDSVPPLLIPWLNLIIIVMTIFALYRLFTSEGTVNWLRSRILIKLKKYRLTKPIPLSEHMIPGAEYGTVSAHIYKGDALLGISIGDIRQKCTGIVPLLLQHKESTLLSPADDIILEIDATLTCFGNVSEIRSLFSAKTI